jgi:hypothetical protein
MAARGVKTSCHSLRCGVVTSWLLFGFFSDLTESGWWDLKIQTCAFLVLSGAL